MKVVIVIPTYNEAENIERLIEALQKSCEEFPQHEASLLVVDDNSPDGTGEIVKKLQKENTNLHILTGRKRGLGYAYLRGMDYALEELKADVLFEIDADFQHDPKEVPEFMKKIYQGYDFVIGSRYIKGGSIPKNWDLTRKINSKAGNLLVRIILTTLSIHDWTSGYRAIRSSVYKKVRKELVSFNGYTFQVAFLYKAIKNGTKVAEIPIQFKEREFGKSKIGVEYIKNLLIYLAKTKFREIVTPRFLKFLVVGTIGFIINTVVLEVLVKLKVRPSLAGATGAELAIISNFILNNLWTFKEYKITSIKQIPGKFIIFNIAAFGSVVIQFLTIETGTRLFGLGTYRIFYVLGVGIGLVWNYFMYNRVVWKTHKKK